MGSRDNADYIMIIVFVGKILCGIPRKGIWTAIVLMQEILHAVQE